MTLPILLLLCWPLAVADAPPEPEITDAEMAVYEKVRRVLAARELAALGEVRRKTIERIQRWDALEKQRDAGPPNGDKQDPHWVWYGDGRGWVYKEIICFPN